MAAPIDTLVTVFGGSGFLGRHVVRALVKRGAHVDVVLSANASRFVAPLALQAVSRNPVVDDVFDRRGGAEVKHIALADTACGYGCLAHLPAGADNFTTIELKSNFLGTARAGTIACVATPVHLGNATQVWDAVVSDRATHKKIALFRCTQMVLWPRNR